MNSGPEPRQRILVKTTGVNVRIGDWLRSEFSKSGLREITDLGLRWDRDSQTLAIRVYFNHAEGQPDKSLLGPEQPVILWREPVTPPQEVTS